MLDTSLVRVVDIPTRTNINQRLLIISPDTAASAAVVLFAGNHGGLQISEDGNFGWGENNFLVRSRNLFADQNFLVVIVDAPSDRQSLPFLKGFRQGNKHVEDIRIIISWIRENFKIPVWLIGSSRGTQSVAYSSIKLTDKNEMPNGIVLTSTILDDAGYEVPLLPLENLRIPVLVIHHEQDACMCCSIDSIPKLMEKINLIPDKELIIMNGGSTRGDPCTSFTYHGFNEIESIVVSEIANWIRYRLNR
jgi:pimeloyl-ACP methyl ester carboxylesterase